MKYLVLILAFAAAQALATQKPDHCKPEPKPRDPPTKSEPPAKSAPEPRATGECRTIQCKVN